MTGREAQPYANHAQSVPGFHRGVLGIPGLNLIVTIVATVKAPGFFTAWSVVLALGLIGLAWYVRAFPLRAQDRVIRLEERLRAGSSRAARSRRTSSWPWREGRTTSSIMVGVQFAEA